MSNSTRFDDLTRQEENAFLDEQEEYYEGGFYPEDRDDEEDFRE